MFTRRLAQILVVVVTSASLFGGSLAGASARGEDRPISQPSTQEESPLILSSGQQPSPSQPSTLDQIVRSSEFVDFVHIVALHVDSTWADLFAASGISYQHGAYVLFEQDGQTPCGVVTPMAEGSFYCAADQTVYLDAYDLAADASEFGRFVIDLTIAHLFARFVMDQLGVNDLSAYGLTLTADCLAGSWAAFAEYDGAISRSDIEDGLIYLIALDGGDDLRASAFSVGFVNDVQACFV